MDDGGEVGLRVVAAAFYNICLCSLQTTDFLLLATEPRGLGAMRPGGRATNDARGVRAEESGL